MRASGNAKTRMVIRSPREAGKASCKNTPAREVNLPGRSGAFSDHFASAALAAGFADPADSTTCWVADLAAGAGLVDEVVG